MNRPSRTDDDLEHPTWNQNPPALASDLTTREDLNGIVNARVLKGPSDGSGAAFGVLAEKGLMFNDGDTSDDYERLRMEMVPLQEHLQPLSLFSRIGQSKAFGWALWAVSVLATSTALSSVGLFTPNGGRESTKFTATPATPPAPSHHAAANYKREDLCASSGVRPEDYDVPLHVGALVIILFVSTLACMFPLLARLFPRLRIPKSFFFVVRHFGTGVLISTAFIHLLPTAFISLGDPCLSAFWTKDYPAMPGAIALAGVFFVIMIEMVFSPARHFSHRCPPNPVLRSTPGSTAPVNRSCDSLSDDDHHTPHARRSVELSTLQQADHISPSGVLTPSGPDGTASAAGRGMDAKGLPSGGDIELLTPQYFLTQDQKLKKAVLQVVLLEIGILFHSVFIGMALSVAIGKEFVVLLIAVAFHQAFEGLALGSRIADIDWSNYPRRPWYMALAYGLTTPIGQAIGLATHTLYSPNSSFGLVLVGTMNAISSGLLVYASLVELVAVDFLSDESWETLRGKKRVVACAIVFFGALAMGLVGAWA